MVAQNPVQIPVRLTTLAKSKELPGQVVACRLNLPLEIQRRVIERARRLSWEFGEEPGALIPVEEVAFDNMRALLAERGNPQTGPVAMAVPASAKLQSSAPGRPASPP